MRYPEESVLSSNQQTLHCVQGDNTQLLDTLLVTLRADYTTQTQPGPTSIAIANQPIQARPFTRILSALDLVEV